MQSSDSDSADSLEDALRECGAAVPRPEPKSQRKWRCVRKKHQERKGQTADKALRLIRDRLVPHN